MREGLLGQFSVTKEQIDRAEGRATGDGDAEEANGKKHGTGAE